MTRSPLAHALIVFAVFFGGFALLFSPIWLAGGVLGTNDVLIYYHPAFVARSFGWTSALYAGYPVAADPQTLTAYPPAVLLGALGAWNAFVISGYALAASFSYGYANRVTRSSLSGWVAGIAFGAGGFAVARLDHVTMLHALAWMPLVLWALEELRREISGRWLGVGSIAVASSLLAGHPQIFLQAALVWAAYAIVAGWNAPAGRARYWLTTAGMGALGLGLAAISWVPALELATESSRTALTREEFFQFSLAPWQLGQLLMPYLVGGAATASVPPVGLPTEWPLPYFGPGRFAEVTGAVGLVPLVLALAALFASLRSRLVAFWAAVAALAIGLALGDSLPWPISELPFWTPGLNRFRIPTRHLLELSFAVAALAALGTKTLADMDAAQRGRLLSGAAMATAAGVLACLAAYVLALGQGWLDVPLHWAKVQHAEALPWRNPALGVQAVVVLLAAGGLWTWHRRESPGAAVLLALGVAVELAAAAALGTWRMSPTEDPGRDTPPGVAVLREELRATGQRMTSLSFDGPDATAPPNRNQLWEVPNAVGYGPLPLTRYAELLGLGPAGLYADAMGRVISPADRTLDLLAVRYLTIPDGTTDSEVLRRENLAFRPVRRGQANWPQVVAYLDRQPRWRRHSKQGGAVVYENRRALPRAWLVSELRVLEDEEILRSVREGALPDGSPFHPRHTALAETPITGAMSCPPPCGEVQLLEDAGTLLRLRANARAKTMLVLSDVLYPGWKAFVDDEAAEIHRVDYALRGVVVPAGEHELRFEFRSASFSLGAGVSLVSALLGVGWVTTRKLLAHRSS